MDGPGYQRKWPVIIAMQGEPYCCKTSVAMVLRRRANYPIIALDDILDGLSPTCPENVEIVMSQAFDIITCMVKRYTSIGSSVIIDSPLSRRSHLDKLVSLVTSVNNEGTTPRLSLVILECKPSCQYWCEIRFINRNGTTSDKWYKPQDWPPHPKFTGRDYTDGDIHPMVSKLVLDTSKGYQWVKLLAALHNLTKDLCGKVTDLLYYYCQQKYCESNNPHKIHCPPLTPIEKEGICQSEGHFLNERKGTDNDEACRICKDQVIASSSDGGVYACKNCPLVIHKSCAEADVTECSAQTFRTCYYMIGTTATEYSFPKLHTCTICRKKSLEFSKNCAACLLESNMKCGLLPTIVHHQKHSHYFQLSLKPSNSMRVVGLCDACIFEITDVYYFYEGPISYIQYHPTCLLSPPFLRGHQHCGYTHDLELIFERDEEFDSYPCHLCFDYMLPFAWYYCCRECCLDLHIKCAFEEFK